MVIANQISRIINSTYNLSSALKYDFIMVSILSFMLEHFLTIVTDAQSNRASMQNTYLPGHLPNQIKTSRVNVTMQLQITKYYVAFTI